MAKHRSIKLILASSSPRRIDLLRGVGVSPEVIKPEIDETRLRHESAKKMVTRLSQEKAKAVQIRSRSSESLILSADTTVVAPDGKTILEKPKNERDAARMLRLLAGKTHTVLTAYSILRGKKIHSRVVSTRVSFRSLSSQEIQDYIRTGEPMDKAGAYCAQGATGMTLIKEIRGSYTNVVGLPIAEVLADLIMMSR